MTNTATNPSIRPKIDTKRYPKCPHCNEEPCRFSFAMSEIGPMRVIEFFCIACQAILSISILEIAPPMIARPT